MKVKAAFCVVNKKETNKCSLCVKHQAVKQSAAQIQYSIQADVCSYNCFMTIAIIGATSRRDKFSNKAVRAFMQHGDKVVPIHPAQAEVEGLRAYTGVLDVPENIDMASFYVPSNVGIRVLEECAQKGIKKIILNPGVESAELLQRAKELNIEAIQTCSIRMIGRTPGEFDD